MKDRIKGLWKVLFGRTTIFIVLILIQILIIFGGVAVLGTKVIIANNIIGVLSVIILIYLLNTNTNSSFKLMWIITIVATPAIGVPFFIFTRLQPDTRYIAKRLNDQVSNQKNLLLPEEGTVSRLEADSGNEYGLFKYLYEEGHYPVYDDTGIEYFSLGEEKFDELVRQLQRARNFIFMEYFIVARGEMWDQILNVLKQKAREGVEVRFMYDGTNTMVNLPKGYPQQLRNYGIQCKIFSPMRPAVSTHQNNRDHRKIAVIDGHTAFTGGINLADEYINRKERFGHWKDTAIMVKGKAAESFTMMFLQMWNVDTKTDEDFSKYLYKEVPADNSVTYGGYIVPYGCSPYDKEQVGKKVYMDIINRANDYVHITTPYLILDEEMINALRFAAQRGIDVKLILPHIPDKKYAYLLARTHYAELISQGVKIYEYTPGFVHAKNFTSDDEKAVVGTINLDFRSLYLHFECAAYIYDNPIVSDIEEDFQKTLRQCQRITMKDCKSYSVIGKICGRALRLIAPLM